MAFMNADIADLAQAVFLMRFLFAVLFLGQLLQIGVQIWHRVRRFPPLDRELADFVHRSYCETQRKDHDLKHDAIYSHFNKRLAVGDGQFRDIERALGRIEGKLEDLKSQGG
jgi:hypothetical protein